ncbi:LOW QUALITY PROTEIN: uncharacterized protein LOC135464962 [Liolophura sinensis]|uniref:LOW QUALITY PROTEIN: uncharacterized protein LOC135464962 n=1 Tax=Liolophura sinensis TaxID=3198878 RepID=UPI003159165A
MQRVGAEPGRPPNTASWFEDSQTTYRHHAAYLNRLRKLRQDLIDHEHNKLAKALERFQTRDSSSTFYLSQRIPGRAAHKRTSGPILSNASERFRRSKKTSDAPDLETIQGKQLLESQGDKEHEEVQVPQPLDKNEIDRTVRENLKRLLQPKPSCSIPTIGRRNYTHSYSTEKENSAEINGAQLSPRSMSVRRSQTHHKFPLSTGIRNGKKQLIRPDSDELDLSPSTFKFERLKKEGSFSRGYVQPEKGVYNVFYVPCSPDPAGRQFQDEEYRETVGNEENVESDSFKNDCKSRFPSIPGKGSPRKRIVVDMPDIVLYPATPDVELNSADKGGQLAKTLKQNQLRQREIANLLEDVKEISDRTEALESNFSNRGS